MTERHRDAYRNSSQGSKFGEHSVKLTESFKECYVFAAVCRSECVYSLEDGDFSQVNLSFAFIRVALGDCLLHRLLPRVS